MKKIRDETLSRTERYSELIKDPDSNEAIFKIIDIDEKKKKKIKKVNSNLSQSNNSNTIGVIDEPKKEEINPNKEYYLIPYFTGLSGPRHYPVQV